MTDRRRLIILGSTGSIGRQTLDVLRHLESLEQQGHDVPTYDIVGLAAGSRAHALFDQAAAHRVPHLALADTAHLADATPPPDTTLRTGPDAAEQLVRGTHADTVMCAMVGVAGLPAALAAVQLGRDTAIANKETLVAAGSLIVDAAHHASARLLPVDSEHAALWMCLAASAHGFRFPPHDAPPDLRRATLTASGGALRDWPLQRLHLATPEDALAHPNWSMGAKVTIDTATLINKAFELVEAHWLFGIPADHLHIAVHPQSIVHAIADFHDGSSIAHLGTPDMRTPILGALTAPNRPNGIADPLSLTDAATLTFEPPDLTRFPAATIGHDIIRRGGIAGAVANAANEAAVNAFLHRTIPINAIPHLTRSALDAIGDAPLHTLHDALDADGQARRYVQQSIAAGDRPSPGAIHA